MGKERDLTILIRLREKFHSDVLIHADGTPNCLLELKIAAVEYADMIRDIFGISLDPYVAFDTTERMAVVDVRPATPEDERLWNSLVGSLM